ncbi:hypothetical protein [Phenylobacterium sp.]|nr:hypothetical protein [Phenylobacterium sp.]HVI30592.1 hypothetical protein [Phenylobacterium sp.]
MQSDEPLWVDLDQVVELNQLIVEDTQEPFQILDRGLPESALYVPRNA